MKMTGTSFIHRLYPRISLYVLGEFFFSFMVAFLFFFFIFFVNQLLVMAEEIFSKNVPFGDVLLFILFSLPAIMALSFPFGTLVGALMAVGRMASDHEILALKASGVSLSRILLPLLIMGLLLSMVSFVMNDYFLPLGNIRLGQIYRKILYTNPGVELEPFSIKRYEDTTIITGDIEGNQIKGITIIDQNENKEKRVIMARSAELQESSTQRGVVSFRLDDVFTQIPHENGNFEYTTSEQMIYNILLKDISVAFINPGPREMSSVDVFSEILEMSVNFDRKKLDHQESRQQKRYDLIMEVRYVNDQSIDSPGFGVQRQQALQAAWVRYQKLKDQKLHDRNLQLYRLEFHKKFSIPIACLVFTIFAFPIGLMARRSGRSVGFGIGLLMTAFYWGLLFLGNTLGIRLQLSPSLAMWFPNFVIIILGGGLLIFGVRR